MSYDPDEGKKHNEAIKEKKFEAGEELRQLLSLEVGRKHVFKTLENSFIFHTTFVKSSETFFNEGRREAALELFNAILDLDPLIFAQMCTEFRKK